MKLQSWKFLSFPPLLLALFIFLNTAPGLAQTPPEATPPQTTEQEATPPEATPQDQETTATTPLEDPAWQLYHQAFIETLRDHHEAAQNLLNQLIQEYPEHGAVPLAHRILAVISLVDPGKPATAPAESAQPDPTTSATPGFATSTSPKSSERTLANGETTNPQARAELVIFQTLHGIAAGLETCLLIECGGPSIAFGSLTLGAGVGLAGSLYLSRNGVTAGQASAYNTGATWGFWNGLALAQTLDINGTAFIGSMLAGQVIGLGGAALAWHLFEPTAGNVSLASSGAIWATVLTTLVHGSTGFNASDAAFWGSLLAATNIGLVGGALLSSEYTVSRGRALVIDSGGILGALVGFSTYLMITDGKNDDGKAAMTSGLIGTVGGLALATYLSRNWDIDDTTAQIFITPTDGGALVGLGGQF